MSQSKYQPANVKVIHDLQKLDISWGDDHVSTYELDGLRRSCPCATCRGGHENMTDTFDPVLLGLPAFQTWQITQLEPIGNHALRICWSDGHSAGMYRWEALRNACPQENTP